MKLCLDVLIQQVLKQIRDIQNIQKIESFKCTWKIFNIRAIVITSYEHVLPIHYILSSKI